LVFEARSEAQHDQRSTELSEALHGEDGTHHGTTPFGSRELGRDDARKRVVAADSYLGLAWDLAQRSMEGRTDAHQHTPKDDEADNGCAGPRPNERLREGCDDDEDELEAVHLLAADNICERAEAHLANDGSRGRRQLDGRVLGSQQNALVVMLVDDAQHDGQQRHAEDVVAVGEEAGPGDQNGADVVPSKGGLVDLGEGQAATLVGVLDVGKVIVEVVERVVPAGRLGGHDEALPMLGLQGLGESRKDKSLRTLGQEPRNGLALELIYIDRPDPRG
jgi:hypothetical protein